MKKMVCEICGSQSIKKENGVFVCQDCGTEYSLEEAKKLLTEVEEKTSDAIQIKSDPKEVNKSQLISILKNWVQYINAFTGYECWFLCDTNLDDPAEYKINSHEFWNMNGDFIRNQQIHLKENIEFSDLNLNWDSVMRRKLFFFDMPPYNFYDELFSYDGELYKRLEKLFDEAYEQDRAKNFGSEDEITYSLSTVDNKYEKNLGDSLLGGDSNVFDFIKNAPNDVADVVITRTRTRRVLVASFFSDATKTVTEKTTLPIGHQVSECIRDAVKKRDAFFKLHSERFNYVKEHFHEMINSYADLMDKKILFEQMFNVPVEYRTVEVLSAVIELLESGRADNWKEAINLFEEEKYRAKVILNLTKANINLERLQTTLYDGFSTINNQLRKISISASEMSDKVSKLLSVSYENNLALKNIMYDTRYSLIRSIFK
jgi:hypothetical protein